MEVDRNGLEVLDWAECLSLLRSMTLGRLALTVDALPLILPVRYAMAEGAVVLCSRTGTKLAAAARNSVVAFEVDAMAEDGTGWSVVVQGIARETLDPSHIDALRAVQVGAWLDGEDVHHIAISTDVVSGRRLFAVDRAQAGSAV